LDKIAENQGWSQDNIQHCHQTKELPEEVKALSTKMEDLLVWLDQRAKFKEDQRAIERAYESSAIRKVPHQPTWRQQNDTQGMSSTKATKQPTLRELIAEQDKISNTLMERLTTNDKVVEDINLKMKDFSCAMEDQLEFNKRMEAKMSQLAATLPVATNIEQVKGINTRGGKSTRDPPYPKGVRRAPIVPAVAREENNSEVKVEIQQMEIPQEREMRQDFHDTTYLPFPCRKRRPQSDE